MNNFFLIISKYDINFCRYIFNVSIINTGGALFIGLVIYLSAVLLNIDLSFYSGKAIENSIVGFIGVSIIAPVVETFILIGILLLIESYVKLYWRIALISGLIWGMIHAVASWIALPIMMWEFFIMSFSYLHVRKKGFWQAYGVIAGVHALNNMFVFLLSV